MYTDTVHDLPEHIPSAGAKNAVNVTNAHNLEYATRRHASEAPITSRNFGDIKCKIVIHS